MKAEELRIGNWVHDGSRFPMQVVAVFHDEVYLNFEGNEGDVWECKIKDLQPFEFTNEWLDRFGFEKREHTNWWHKGNFTYWQDQNIWYWRMEAIHPDLTMYVHQLQNLYHALTGEEI